MRHDSPPRLALRLLAWRVPEPDREYLIGDLLEAFVEEQSRSGPAAARRWFWRETIQLMTSRFPSSPNVVESSSRGPSMSFLNTARLSARSLLRAPALIDQIVAVIDQ